MPIENIDDAKQLEKHLKRFFEVSDSDRANVLREMYVGEMDFESAQGTVQLQPTPKNVHLPEFAERIATAEGFHVVYVQLRTDVTKRVRNSEAVQAAKLIRSALDEDMVLLMSNSEGTQLHFILPTFETATPMLRRMVIERDLPRRTAVEQLSNCYYEWQRKTLRQALRSAYDVEAVTKRFFEGYRDVFEEVEKSVEGFGTDSDELEARHLFTQTLFNRLMFVYFISRKGWLSFNGDTEYLAALWKAHHLAEQNLSFFKFRLETLFFTGLNNEQSIEITRNNEGLELVIGKVPFLNGGLFDKTEIEKEHKIDVPDEAIALIVGPSGIFERFNFTIMESTPFDVEVAVDPEMLGKVFEELVTGRHKSGSYYTPRPVVSFMCREALKGHLESHVEDASSDEIAAFVDQRDPAGFSLAQAQQASIALADVRVIDPACGSGAYLLGMMQELIELSAALYSSDLEITPKSLYDLKLHIIERNLYGVDIDEFAVNIAMLRLWLSLAIDFEGDKPEPLPNLDFKIIVGDSLAGPNPTEPGQLEMFQQQAKVVAAEIAELKRRYISIWGSEKLTIKQKILELEARMSDLQTLSNLPGNSVDWRTRYAEIFVSNAGFDIALANPPYVSAIEFTRTRPEWYRDYLKTIYRSTKGAWDLFVPFFERSIQLLNPSGVLCFITPNKYLSAPYAKELRSFMLSSGSITVIADVSQIRIFPSASVNPVITVFINGIGQDGSISCLLPSTSGGEFETTQFDRLVLDATTLTLLPDNIWGYLLSPHVVLLEKIVRNAERLEKYGRIQATSTAAESDEYGHHITDNPPRSGFKIVNTGLIDPYKIRWGNHRFIHAGSRYATPYLPTSAISANRARLYSKPKVLFAKLSKRPEAALDVLGEFGGLNINCFHSPRSDTSLEFIVGFCNSNIFRFLYDQFFGALRMGSSYQFQAPQLRLIPLRSLPSVAQEQIVREVGLAISADASERESRMKVIDGLFYDAYGLDRNEIQELENSIPNV